MDNYFIDKIEWNKCTNPINALEFSISISELEKLESVLEMLGLTLFENIADTLTTEEDYLSLNVDGTCIELVPCSERIAPVPIEYISTIVPALILAHIREPKSVKQLYNDFFINKKEEITPLLNQ